MLPSSVRLPAPRLYWPVPTKSARVFTADGWHGPGSTTEHSMTCASWLCQLNRISRPSRYTCCHSLPVGPPPSWAGLELPPNVLCFLPRLSPSSFRQPPPVRRQMPVSTHGLIGVVTSSESVADASPQKPWTVTSLMHSRVVLSHSGASSSRTVASNVNTAEPPAAIELTFHTIVPDEPSAGADVGAGFALFA